MKVIYIYNIYNRRRMGQTEVQQRQLSMSVLLLGVWGDLYVDSLTPTHISAHREIISNRPTYLHMHEQVKQK